MKVATTIPKLDELLGGGVEDGSSILILADMLVDKGKFISHIVSNRLSLGDNAVYFVNTKLPSFVKSEIRNWDTYKDKIDFVDAISFSLGKKSEEKYVVNEKTTNVKEFEKAALDVFKKALEERGFGTLGVFDSLDFWVGDKKGIIDFVNTLKDTIKDTHTVCFYLLANVGFKEKDVKDFLKNFDYVIQLRSLERKGLIIKYIKGEKPKVELRIPFELTPTGINIYVPKILITGPFNSGKSTMIRALSERSVSVDTLGTTVGLDHGYVERAGFSVDLFGTPGQERFDWALKLLAKTIFGVFLIVDSTKPETFPRAKEMLEKLKVKGIPVVVLANKQDLPGAMSPEAVGKKLGFKAIGTVATTGEGCEEALKELFDMILKEETWYK